MVRLLLIQASHPRCRLLLDVQKVVDDKEIVLLEKCLLCLCHAAIDHSSLCLLVLWQKYMHDLEKDLSALWRKIEKDDSLEPQFKRIIFLNMWKRSLMC